MVLLRWGGGPLLILGLWFFKRLLLTDAQIASRLSQSFLYHTFRTLIEKNLMKNSHKHFSHITVHFQIILAAHWVFVSFLKIHSRLYNVNPSEYRGKKKVNKDVAERWKLNLPVLATTYPLGAYFQQFLLGIWQGWRDPITITKGQQSCLVSFAADRCRICACFKEPSIALLCLLLIS